LQARDECQIIVRVRLHVHDVDLDVRREHRHELVDMLAEGGALELSVRVNVVAACVTRP
jgi:hypothetical protein